MYSNKEPTFIDINNDGSITYEWWFNGKSHREDGPSFIKINNDGIIIYEKWYKNGQKHREDGPSFIKRNEKGFIINEIWFDYGKFHREDGPAIIERDEDGEISNKEWYLDNKKYSYEEFNEKISSLRNKIIYILEETFNDSDTPLCNDIYNHISKYLYYIKSY